MLFCSEGPLPKEVKWRDPVPYRAPPPPKKKTTTTTAQQQNKKQQQQQQQQQQQNKNDIQSSSRASVDKIEPRTINEPPNKAIVVGL